MSEPFVYLAVFVVGVVFGIIITHYGLRVGNKLTIAAINREPLDDRTVSNALQIPERTG